ncbi:MAG: hypothetical protein QOG98_1012 [Pseudonocardiales bacterium]|nr:hypothetical protein [Pseudonocardiales bacterium]
MVEAVDAVQGGLAYLLWSVTEQQDLGQRACERTVCRTQQPASPDASVGKYPGAHEPFDLSWRLPGSDPISMWLGFASLSPSGSRKADDLARDGETGAETNDQCECAGMGAACLL